MSETDNFSKYRRGNPDRLKPKRYPLERTVIRKYEYGTLAIPQDQESQPATVTDLSEYKRNKKFGAMYGRIIDTLKDLS